MNTPNKLTIFRIILTPVFLAVLLWEGLPHRFLWGLILFCVASVTDMIDGKLARKYNQITVFGKFLDPVADKMLVTAALLALMQMGLCNIWIVFVILTREFIVTSVRLVASCEGEVIPANLWGKLKTVSQMVFIILVLALKEAAANGWLHADFPLVLLSNVLMGITAALTVISGVIYVWNSRGHINVLK